MLIGIERSNRSKEAGTRTHFIVACGAALIMVVSKYAFFDVITQGLYNGVEVRLDPSRVASTIASGRQASRRTKRHGMLTPRHGNRCCCKLREKRL